MPRYSPALIEPKWQAYWDVQQTFAAPRAPNGPKIYVLDMFPYPSGDGLHVGHPEGYTATDIVCRYKRMRGFSVMHPMGFDAFGLPAEQHAKKTGTPPRVTTEKNISTFRRQLKMLGFSYDWQRELATTDVPYFRWTQWIFLELYDTWFDADQQRGRPIAELPIPAEVAADGNDAIRAYQDDHRLAYQLEAPVNWCPALGTVLANEEVIDGKSERGSHPVIRLPLRQWMLRITAYADRLEKDLEGLDWSESIKALQRNWIGRSTGAEVDFYLGKNFAAWKAERAKTGFPAKPDSDSLRIYTTRPDTLYGATYMVIAPEHPLVDQLTAPERKAEVEAYRKFAAGKSDLDRTDLAKEKTGVFTGAYATNPVNGKPTPIWIADYVLISYGSGAIMAVPAHDERDYEFAMTFQLPIKAVVDPGKSVDESYRDCVLAGKKPFCEHGAAINSEKYNGISTAEFKTKITADLSSAGLGREAVKYKLRDWLFSRQHFWGEPFPLLHELDANDKPTGRVIAVSPSDLPVDLPELKEFKSTGTPDPPLEAAPREWLYPTFQGKRYKRETNTMPQWAGSCWYYLRFLDPKNTDKFVDPAIEKAWMPVDLYIGGAEHAVLHLLYSRFWHKVLYDRGHVGTIEPFHKLVNQGMILGETEITGYQTANGRKVSANLVKPNAAGELVDHATGEPVTALSYTFDECEKTAEGFVLKAEPNVRVESRAYKMSKSRGNVVNPDQVVKDYGADSLRLYEMFMGPLEASKPWSMEGVSGVRSFLDRFWRLIVNDKADEIEVSAAVQEIPATSEQEKFLHRTIYGVTDALDRLSFNTAIAKLMEFTNFFTKQDPRPRSVLQTAILLLAPMAPHIAEELWQILGGKSTLAYEPWPTYDEAMLKDDVVEVPVQVNGKLRGRVSVAADASQEDHISAAQNDPNVSEWLTGKQIVKTIVLPGKMVNFVVR